MCKWLPVRDPIGFNRAWAGDRSRTWGRRDGPILSTGAFANLRGETGFLGGGRARRGRTRRARARLLCLAGDLCVTRLDVCHRPLSR